MTLFLVIFIGLVVVNALLLAFSSSVSTSLGNRQGRAEQSRGGYKIYPFDSLDREFRKAV